MAGYNKDKLALISQGIVGHKVWAYTDTGDIGDIQEVAGFVTNGNDMGMDSGDMVFVRMTAGGTNRMVRGAAVQNTTDTGGTQTTIGLGTVVGDTS